MKKTALIGCVCLALAGCGGASSDDGRKSTRSGDDTEEDAGGGKDRNQDDDVDDDAADDADDDAADDDEFVPVEDDDLFMPVEEDDDLFIEVEDDDFAPAPVIGDDDVVTPVVDDDVADDDVVTPVADDDVVTPVMDDDVPVMDDDVPVEPDVPVTPSECMQVSQSISTSSCYTTERCGNSYYATSCSDYGDGSWMCSCNQPNFYGSYELTGVTSSTACPTAKDLCSQGLQAEFTGDPVCDDTSQYLGSYSCSTQNICRRTAEIAPGVNAVEQTYTYASCSFYNTDQFSCYCSDNFSSRSFTATGLPEAEACQLTLGVCEGTIPLSEAESCTNEYSQSSSTYCSTSRTCGQTIDFGDGGMGTINQSESESCNFASDGTATCSCYSINGSRRFRLMEGAGLAACQTSRDVCASTEDLVPEGPIECTVASQSASGSYCNAYLECSQFADMNGTPVGLIGNLSTYCSPVGDGYSCSCSSGSQSTSVEIAADSAWDACTASLEQCPELVEVDVTSTNYGYVY